MSKNHPIDKIRVMIAACSIPALTLTKRSDLTQHMGERTMTKEELIDWILSLETQTLTDELKEEIADAIEQVKP